MGDFCCWGLCWCGCLYVGYYVLYEVFWMNWANWVVIILFTLSLGVSIGQHGKEDKTNAWHSLFWYIVLGVLFYFGGFFK